MGLCGKYTCYTVRSDVKKCTMEGHKKQFLKWACCRWQRFQTEDCWKCGHDVGISWQSCTPRHTPNIHSATHSDGQALCKDCNQKGIPVSSHMPLLFTMSLFSTAERPDSPFSSVTWSRGALDNLLGQLVGVQGAQDKKKSKLYGKIGKQIITLCVPFPLPCVQLYLCFSSLEIKTSRNF